MSAPGEPDMERLRQSIRDQTAMMRYLAENPEVMDDWSPAERAWVHEHIELYMQQVTELREMIRRILDGPAESPQT